MQWEQDVIVGIKILKVLAQTWRSSVTEEAPPAWLLEGVPRLLLQLLSMRDCGDRIALCCLELGIEVLHGGNEFFQESLYDIMRDELLGAPDLFAHLQDRLRRAEAEGRLSRRISFEAPAQKEALLNLIRIGKQRDLHGLVVQAAKNDPRLDTSHVGLVIRFLHLLCEGHNEKLQNFLRAQQNSSRSVDMVSGIANYVDAVTPYINSRIVAEVTRAMSALSEFVQNPCRPNQLVLVDTRLCACANEILGLEAHGEAELDEHAAHEHDEEDEEHETLQHKTRMLRAKQERAEYQKQINELKAATATTLLSLLECVDQPYIPERMLVSLDSNRLIDNMNGLLKLYDPLLLIQLKDRHESGEFPLTISKHVLNPFEVLEETLESGADEDAEKVAQQYYITFITLASFDKAKRLQVRSRVNLSLFKKVVKIDTNITPLL